MSELLTIAALAARKWNGEALPYAELIFKLADEIKGDEMLSESGKTEVEWLLGYIKGAIKGLLINGSYDVEQLEAIQQLETRIDKLTEIVERMIWE